MPLLHLLTITIGWDPNIATFGSLQLTWHGVFTAVGIAAGVYLGAYLGRRQGFTEDDAYSVALVGVPTGIIGARAMYVLENNEAFRGQWLDVLKINEGGITIYGAVIGGVLGAVVYGLIRKMPIMRGLDVAAFGLLLGMGIGRLGDLVNGEHVAKASSLPWATEYTNPASPSWQYGPTHPATTYEMLGDFLIIAVMAVLFVQLWRHRPGIVFFTGLVLYSAMRFGVSYLRIDSGYGCPNSVGCPDHVIKDWMTFPQVVSTITFGLGMLGLAWSILRGEQPAPAGTVLAAGVPENPLDRKPASSRSTS
ncbi:MAG: prolipoprotein diacylglyceryl transferase [Chloroflexi bacterium]|nr:prolipoprotein diacylglyceryl transferase [Chloroflexota bacterium]